MWLDSYDEALRSRDRLRRLKAQDPEGYAKIQEQYKQRQHELNMKIARWLYGDPQED